jgi:hypothetical protein
MKTKNKTNDDDRQAAKNLDLTLRAKSQRDLATQIAKAILHHLRDNQKPVS